MHPSLLRFFLGSNKVMQIALGRTAADEVKEGIHEVSKFLQGNTGLVCTNLPKDKVQSLFEAYEEHDFARTGSVAKETVMSLNYPCLTLDKKNSYSIVLYRITRLKFL
ncbi:mRNA turnover protein 4 homolog [Amborella trichopoda]|nr:mRNA turnover protein 4 homolog [Amborella trichopoda]|eukprot:XP_020525639.1 mRNA turnover protein 4 homolog [Amborella trichopoda]